MHIGICKITLRLPENQSLKGKRRVIVSLCGRLKQRFNIAIAEVSDLDLWQSAVLGLVCVSNESRHLQQILGQVLKYLQEQTGEFELIKFEEEFVSGV